MATAINGDQDANLASSPTHTIKPPSTPSTTQQASIDSDDEDSDDEGQDEEPKLKYSRLTGSLGAVYRAGDSSSAFLVAGDKMVCPDFQLEAQSFRKLQYQRVYAKKRLDNWYS